MKKIIDFSEKSPFKSVSRFDYYFVVLMKTRISSEYVHVPRVKVLIFTNLMYLCIIIVENTQAQYFDNLISNCT